MFEQRVVSLAVYHVLRMQEAAFALIDQDNAKLTPDSIQNTSVSELSRPVNSQGS